MDRLSEGTITVLLVDDHPIFREGTRRLLEAEPDIHVVGEADRGDVVVAMAFELAPRVVLLDVRLPGLNGIEVLQRLGDKAPLVRVLMLSAHLDEDYARTALAHGAAGYVAKTLSGAEIAAAVRAVCAGSTVVDPALSASLFGGDGRAWHPPLTSREKEVLALVTRGLPNKAVAARLDISRRTVEAHVRHLFEKMGVASRTELAAVTFHHELSEDQSSWHDPKGR